MERIKRLKSGRDQAAAPLIKVAGEPGPQTLKPGAKRNVMSLLINSVYYFLQCVFILVRENSYRLVVVHNNRLLVDRDYKTMRGARIAFKKMFGHKAWKGKVKNEWSCFYLPDDDWLEEKKLPLKTFEING